MSAVIDRHLQALSRTTLVAAPRPAPVAVIRILAARREAHRRAKWLLAALALARVALLLLLFAAWVLHPVDSTVTALLAAVLVATLLPQGARLLGVGGHG